MKIQLVLLPTLSSSSCCHCVLAILRFLLTLSHLSPIFLALSLFAIRLSWYCCRRVVVNFLTHVMALLSLNTFLRYELTMHTAEKHESATHTHSESFRLNVYIFLIRLTYLPDNMSIYCSSVQVGVCNAIK